MRLLKLRKRRSEGRLAQMRVIKRSKTVLMQRCPRCCEGRVFRGRIAMNETCPSCGYRFEREPGYFTAAMYFSYPLAVAAIGVPIVAVRLLTRWPYSVAVGLGIAALGLCIPAIFRYSRTLWMHFDYLIQPENP